MSGILHTFGWTTLHKNFAVARSGDDGTTVLDELLIPLAKVLYVQKHKNNTAGDICLVALTETGALTCDIPFKQMKHIMKEYYKNPEQDFETHPAALLDEDGYKIKPEKTR